MIIIAVLSDERIKSLGVHIMKARHCSHCFQCLLSQPGAGFFFFAFFSPRSLLACLCHGFCRNNLPAEWHPL
ncbi:hypothetical protein [Yersinia pseudotuberculosis]|uniref:hypothetical protein n=1 Tax=Yersinia pseudotuberculosis TaxID=633 RepID=UPI001A9DE84D|nr:hypothetical protein [Yersinia pseudotuberculosis]MBO1551558.1 hypothetical protein [Yersinia pseudotuberculosis]MBO1571608.1 hypothetical protein [Yersinia pseudotuberculosis]MBO1586556.1 hypothetical protein [Yersinia pseudotuberculosis]MBO1636059.1 hypothetical protein [Yersinia pseudotuberculosis]